MLSVASDIFSQSEHLPDGEAEQLVTHRPLGPSQAPSSKATLFQIQAETFQAQFNSYGGCL